MVVRESAEGLSTAVKVSVRVPFPELGATSAQIASARAVQSHEAGAVMVNDVRDSLDPTVAGSPVTDVTHPAEPLAWASPPPPPLEALGPVVEFPPHAAMTSEAATGRSAR